MVIDMGLFAYQHPAMTAPFVEDDFVGFFVKNKMYIGMCINVKVFDSISLINVSAIMSITNCFYYYSSIVELEVRDGVTSADSFIVQNFWLYWAFCFPI